MSSPTFPWTGNSRRTRFAVLRGMTVRPTSIAPTYWSPPGRGTLPLGFAPDISQDTLAILLREGLTVIYLQGCGAPDRTRTYDTVVNSHVLLPTELQGHIIYGLSLFVYHRKGYSFSLSGDSHNFYHIFLLLNR